LTDVDELLQSGRIRGLYPAGRGGREVIMFVAVIGVMVFDLRGLSGFSFLSGYSAGCLRAGFLNSVWVLVVEDTHIVLVLRLPTSLRTTRGPSSPAFHTLDDSAVAAQDVNASFMELNAN
jgi:hypothetical protein